MGQMHTPEIDSFHTTVRRVSRRWRVSPSIVKKYLSISGRHSIDSYNVTVSDVLDVERQLTVSSTCSRNDTDTFDTFDRKSSYMVATDLAMRWGGVPSSRLRSSIVEGYLPYMKIDSRNRYLPGNVIAFEHRFQTFGHPWADVTVDENPIPQQFYQHSVLVEKHRASEKILSGLPRMMFHSCPLYHIRDLIDAGIDIYVNLPAEISATPYPKNYLESDE